MFQWSLFICACCVAKGGYCMLDDKLTGYWRAMKYWHILVPAIFPRLDQVLVRRFLFDCPLRLVFHFHRHMLFWRSGSPSYGSGSSCGSATSPVTMDSWTMCVWDGFPVALRALFSRTEWARRGLTTAPRARACWAIRVPCRTLRQVDIPLVDDGVECCLIHEQISECTVWAYNI